MNICRAAVVSLIAIVLTSCGGGSAAKDPCESWFDSSNEFQEALTSWSDSLITDDEFAAALKDAADLTRKLARSAGDREMEFETHADSIERVRVALEDDTDILEPMTLLALSQQNFCE